MIVKKTVEEKNHDVTFMTAGEALTHVITGKRMSREDWGGYYIMKVENDLVKFYAREGTVSRGYNSEHPIVNEDLMAKDWYHVTDAALAEIQEG